MYFFIKFINIDKIDTIKDNVYLIASGILNFIQGTKGNSKFIKIQFPQKDVLLLN